MKKLPLLLIGLVSLCAVGFNSVNVSAESEKASPAQTQQVQVVPCNPENYCGPEYCAPNNCYTDTVCAPTQATPVPCAVPENCAPVPCNTDTVCAPAPCVTPAPVPTTGCGGC